DTDQHLLGAGSGQGGAEVGDVFGAGVGQQAGAAPFVLSGESDPEAAIWFGQARPALGTSPRIEATGVDDQPGQGGAVPAQVLGRGVAHHVGAVVPWPVQRREARVESTTTATSWAWAIVLIASRSTSSAPGLAMDSTSTARVSGRIARSQASRS